MTEGSLPAVGAGGVEDHGDGGEEVHTSDEEADMGDAKAGDLLQDGRCGEDVGIVAGEHAEHEDAKQPDARVAEDGEDGLVTAV